MKPFRNFYKGFIDIILQLIKQEKYHSKLYMQWFKLHDFNMETSQLICTKIS